MGCWVMLSLTKESPNLVPLPDAIVWIWYLHVVKTLSQAVALPRGKGSRVFRKLRSSGHYGCVLEGNYGTQILLSLICPRHGVNSFSLPDLFWCWATGPKQWGRPIRHTNLWTWELNLDCLRRQSQYGLLTAPQWQYFFSIRVSAAVIKGGGPKMGGLS